MLLLVRQYYFFAIAAQIRKWPLWSRRYKIWSELLYLDSNKKRTSRWLQSVGLQLPAGTTITDSIGSISYTDGKVKIKSVPSSQYIQYAGKNTQEKFSLQLDNEYLELAKDPEKNQAKLQEMVDKAAEKFGYTVKAYHGTTAKKFNVFSPNSYFSPNYKYAEQYSHVLQSDGTNEPKVYTVYLKPGNVKEVLFRGFRCGA